MMDGMLLCSQDSSASQVHRGDRENVGMKESEIGERERENQEDQAASFLLFFAPRWKFLRGLFRM